MWPNCEYDDDTCDDCDLDRSELPESDLKSTGHVFSKNLTRLRMIPWFTSGFI
jgi:hypothetical protein